MHMCMPDAYLISSTYTARDLKPENSAAHFQGMSSHIN